MFFSNRRAFLLLQSLDMATCMFTQPSSYAGLLPCGDAFYHPDQYDCYGSFLCPIIDGTPTLKCGRDCYLPSRYSCSDDHLVWQPNSSTEELPSVSVTIPKAASSTSASTSTSSTDLPCPHGANTLHLTDLPYENYFYSDCRNISTQVIVTSPQPDSNLTIIGPRLLVAWPAGNSGIVTYLQPQNGINGSLGISLVNFTSAQQPLLPLYTQAKDSSINTNPDVGVSGLLRVNSSAALAITILGSIRTIRDFTEGPSILVPRIQDAIQYSQDDDGNIVIQRAWLDNVTTTRLTFSPSSDGARLSLDNRTVSFGAGTYVFNASFNYEQLEQLSPPEVLRPDAQALISQSPDQTTSLSFLSYTSKLLAGAWRFFTYFGRDSMISLLLLQPVLSEGEGGAIEAVIAAVLERVNRTDGSVCHEETIGDYATYLNEQMNITSTTAQCDYKMSKCAGPVSNHFGS